jgi:hypothetical protein
VEGGSLKAGDDAAEVAWVPLESATEYPLTPTMFELLDILRGDQANVRESPPDR